MALAECGRGHVYDPNLYGSCPYCNNQQGSLAGGTPVTEAGRTMPLNRAAEQAPQNLFANQTPVGNDGLTAPPKNYQGAKSVTEDNRTMGYMREKMGVEPVVGWLVCIRGGNKGKGYELMGRVNSIGRSEKMDISIKNDKLISSENHARLSYSEKTNHFHLVPAEGKNVIYINEEEIFTAQLLHAYDVIDFGETSMLFIPLCSDKFKWSDMDDVEKTAP